MLLLAGGRGIRELTVREILNLTYAHLSSMVPELDTILTAPGSPEHERELARQNQEAMRRLTGMGGGVGFIPPPGGKR